MSIKLKLGRATLHEKTQVSCSGSVFQIPLPVSPHNFSSLATIIDFKPEYLHLIEILSNKRDQVASIEEFYRLEQESLKYFNINLELNYGDLATKVLSDNSELIDSLDKFRYQDILAVCKKGYDVFSEKLYSKFNRRLKKYLGASLRSEQEKKQINTLIQLIKSQSSEQENYTEQQSKTGKYKGRQEKQINKDKGQEIKIQEDQAGPDQQKGNLNKQGKKEKRPKKHDHNNRKARQQAQEIEDSWQDVKEQKGKKHLQKKLRNKKIKQDIDFDHHKLKQQLDKQNASDEPEQFTTVEPKRRNKKEYVSKDKYEGSQKTDISRLFNFYQEKNKGDARVALGAFGDSENGWRERLRLQKVPTAADRGKDSKPKYREKQVSKQITQKFYKAPQSQSSNNNKSEAVSASVGESKKVQATSGQLKKIFKFPQDGKEFKLDQSKQYKLKVNDNFWVTLQKKRITIQKDANGYIRDSSWESNKDYIVEGQDITLSLKNMCNLEDGGTVFGKPSIQDFTGGDNQWFTLRSLQVYSYI